MRIEAGVRAARSSTSITACMAGRREIKDRLQSLRPASRSLPVPAASMRWPSCRSRLQPRQHCHELLPFENGLLQKNPPPLRASPPPPLSRSPCAVKHHPPASAENCRWISTSTSKPALLPQIHGPAAPHPTCPLSTTPAPAAPDSTPFRIMPRLLNQKKHVASRNVLSSSITRKSIGFKRGLSSNWTRGDGW